MPLKQGSNAPVTKLPFQLQDKPALGTTRIKEIERNSWCVVKVSGMSRNHEPCHENLSQGPQQEPQSQKSDGQRQRSF